jgi:hypothetical protein
VEARGSDRDGQQVATIVISARDAMYRVAATLPRYPEIEPGSIIKVDGALEPPPDGPYGDYLHRTGVVATIRPRTLTVTGAAGGPAAALERLRRGAGDALAAAIPEPEAGLALGSSSGFGIGSIAIWPPTSRPWARATSSRSPDGTSRSSRRRSPRSPDDSDDGAGR